MEKDNQSLSHKQQQHSLEKLELSIKKAKSKQQIASNCVKSRVSDLTPWNIASDLVAGIGTGVFIGICLDRMLHTLPVFFILCTLCGGLGGLYNLYRTTMSKFDIDKQAKHVVEKTDVSVGLGDSSDFQNSGKTGGVKG
jgi:F0F1-type ATP synthase assembly protein I